MMLVAVRFQCGLRCSRREGLRTAKKEKGKKGGFTTVEEPEIPWRGGEVPPMFRSAKEPSEPPGRSSPRPVGGEPPVVSERPPSFAAAFCMDDRKEKAKRSEEEKRNNLENAERGQ